MLARYYRVTGERGLQCLPDAKLEEILSSDGVHWVDLQSSRPQEIRQWLEPLALHPLVHENLLESERSTHVACLNRATFFEFPVRPELSTELMPEAEDKAQFEHARRYYISVILRPNLLVTIHDGPIKAQERLFQLLTGGVTIIRGDVAGLVYEMLDALIDDSMLVTMHLRRSVASMSHQLDEHPEQVAPRDIMRLERRIEHLVNRCEDQLGVVRYLLAAEAKLPNGEIPREYFQELQTNLEQTARSARRLESRTDDLRLYLSMGVQNRSERRLAVLTMISAVFTPLTLIAGIYGMNFADMPELHYHYAYPATLLAMLVIAVGMLAFFYVRGWFRFGD